MADRASEGALRVYAHRTFRDVRGDLYSMQTHLADLFTVDTRGWGADHSRVPRLEDVRRVDPVRAARYVRALRARSVARGTSKHAQPPPTPAWLRWSRRRLSRSRFVLVPLQIPRDYVARHHASVSVLEFIDLEFIDIVEDAARRARIPFALKLHPYNTRDEDIQERARAAARSPYVRLVRGNIHELLDASAAVWTINSGVGFEALVHARPVVVFGNCDYRSVAFRAVADDLEAALDYTLRPPRDSAELAQRFVYYYCTVHGYRLSDGLAAKRRLRSYLSALFPPQEDAGVCPSGAERRQA